MTKKVIFLKFQLWGLWPILADDRPKCGRYGPLKSLVSPKIFIIQFQKLMILSQKNITPPQKGPFFWGGGVKLHVHLIQV